MILLPVMKKNNKEKMNSDTDEDDPWGEEPHWAIQNRSTINGDEENKKGSSSSKWDNDNDESLFAAQHLLILIDCHPSMFIPSVCIQQDDDDDDNEDYAKENKKKINSSLISPFDAALMSCEKLLRLRVHYVATSKANGKRDGVGVLLFGITKKKPVDMENEDNDDGDYDESYLLDLSPTLHELIPIAPPGTQQILQIRNSLPKGFDDYEEDSQESKNINNDCIKASSRIRDLQKEFVDENDNDTSNNTEDTVSSLRSALHEAIKLFMNAKCVKKSPATSDRPLDAKTIWIFTNQDNPCQGNEREKQQSIVIAKDAIENGIEIHLWPLKDSNNFNTNTFYRHIASHSQAFGTTSSTFNHENQFNPNNSNDNSATGTIHSFHLDDVLAAVKNNWKKTRKLQSIPLLFPDWQEKPDCPGIMLDIYQLIKFKRKPMPVVVHQETNKATQRMTQTLAISTGEIIDNKDRLVSFVEFGGQRVRINKEEIAEIKKCSNTNSNFASLILCGFKSCSGYSLSQLWQHTLEKSLFAYPNDDMISGSDKAFWALHSSMIKKKVYGIGELLLRVTASSRMVAILPQEKLNDDDDVEFETSQCSPAGFVLIPLPFEDDIRAIPETPCQNVDNITIDAAVDLIRHQQLNGIEIGYSFENPALQKFWHYIECIALGTKLKKKLEDETQMDTEKILFSAKAQIDTFKVFLPDDDKDDLPPTKRRKK